MGDDPRMAGGIRRWHIWPVLQQQTVAEHSWNVARVLLAIWPDAPRELVIEALFHDCGEISTGDPPSTLKQRYPALRDIYSKMEYEVRLGMVLPWGLPPPQRVTEPERWVLKMADMIEMWEFVQSERLLGNRFVTVMSIQILEWISAEIATAPEAYSNWCLRAEDYVSKRAREWGI
jgi:5'-deoxynucleotidase YfbR-like HD superfamily hydrolase